MSTPPRTSVRRLVALCALWPLGCGADAAVPSDGAMHLSQVTVVEHGEDGAARTVATAATATVQASGNGAAQHVQASGGTAEPALEITAPASSWDLRARTARFTGGVVASRGQVELHCDTLEVRYASGDRLEQAVATGAVQVLQGERRATAGRAVLTTQSGRVSLTDGPTLADGPNTMSGDEIVLFLDDERVECTACRVVVDGAAVAPR